MLVKVFMTYYLDSLLENYSMEFDRVISEIKKVKAHPKGVSRKSSSKILQGAKIVLLQFPDGLKPYATAVVDYLEEQIEKVEFVIWMGSCYGACDTPVLTKELENKIDLVIQFGHNDLMPCF